MRHSFTQRAVLNLGVALAAFTSVAAGAAQTPPATTDQATPPDAGDDVVVVTARRREETLIDVPIAITAYSGAQLERAGAIDITDLSNTTPNVTLENSRATNSTLTAFIRGIGQQDPVSGFEQGVGIYLDDVYLNRPQASVLDIYDVDRIEVLRGPQGTLYGRNTVGGAVKYVTKRLPAEPEMNIKLTYGSYDQKDGVISASTPIGSDGVVRIGGALAGLNRDGFGRNLTTGLQNYNKRVLAGRGTVEVHGSDIFARLTADYTRDLSNPRNGHREIVGLLSGAPVLADVYDTRGGLNTPRQKVKSGGVSFYLEGKPSDIITVRSITAYRKDNSATPIDFDALPTVDVDVPGFYKNHQLSQEVQLLVDTGRFHGLFGGYYLDADALTQFEARIYTSSPALFPRIAAFTDADVRTNTLAGFADLTFDATDQFSVSVGGRYTWDERKARIFRQNYYNGGSPVFGSAGGIALGAATTNFRGTSVFTKFTPRASVSFKPTPDHNLFASYSKGFKGGGFDPRGAAANAPDLNGNGIKDDNEVSAFLSFAPESVNSYELGYKGALLDRRLTVALSAFRADYKNVQVPSSVACVVPGPTPGSTIPSFCGVTGNAGKARFQGIEAEGTARIGGGFSLSGTLGYIDAKYRKYVTAIGGVPTDVHQYRHVQNTPKWTSSATAAYSTPAGSGSIDASATWSYRSKTYQFEIANPYLDQKGYSLFDANLVYRAEGGRWSFGIHGKNLLDKQYRTSGYPFMLTNAITGDLVRTTAPTPVAACGTTLPTGSLVPALGCEGTLTTFYGNPRQIFGTFTIKF